MKKPVIGIAGNLHYESNPTLIGVPYDFNNNNYSKCIVKAGGIPIYLPVVDDISIIDGQLSLIDGLLLPGGDDINPLFYNNLPKPLQGHSFEAVDTFQIYLIKEALKLQLPILGICRGLQTLNVAAGGTLYQDVSYANPNHINHIQNSFLANHSHPIQLVPKSIVYNILGCNYVVNSSHHQCVKDVAPLFFVTATAPDGIIEGIEMKSRNFVIGVQWHPEMLSLDDETMFNLFRRFIDSCKLS
ncbi:MAG: gamma-glutamyl-gamma-aminobutyrate hydrolase family protein [Clostridium sp.]